MECYTIGHSTRSLEVLVDLLREYGVQTLADVRRYPSSRRHPHLARGSLETALPEIGIDYVWLGGLGGWRKKHPGSPHTAWQSDGFAGYADHMESEEFLAEAGRLVKLAERSCTAIMCAEAIPEKCHRRLLSDWLLSRGHRVMHILGSHQCKIHVLTPFARFDGDRVVYDGGQGEIEI